MLARKQQALRAQIAELEDSAAYIDWKQTFYSDVLAGCRPYVSNLIPELQQDAPVADSPCSSPEKTRAKR